MTMYCQFVSVLIYVEKEGESIRGTTWILWIIWYSFIQTNAFLY